MSRLDDWAARISGVWEPRPEPSAPPAPTEDNWREWMADEMSVSGREPVKLPPVGERYTPEQEDAENAVLADLASLTAVHGSWQAARLTFTSIGEEQRSAGDGSDVNGPARASEAAVAREEASPVSL